MRCSLTIRVGGLLTAVLAAGLMTLPNPLQSRATAKGKKYALLVGINTYEHEDLKSLKYTENDVEELAKILGKPSAGFAPVRVLTATRGKKNPKDRPTAANIRAAIAELAKGVTGEDLILLALSGHGVELSVPDPAKKGPNKEYHYFCPADATLEGVSYSTGEHEKLLHLKIDVFRKLGDCPGSKVILIDACRNELEAKFSRRSIDTRVELHKNLAVLFSCRSGQKSWETDKLDKGHGVFFYQVLQGLRGKAPKNAKNEITWDHLIAHVKDELNDEYMQKLIGGGARQTPHGMGSLVGSLPLLTVDSEITLPDVPALVKGKQFTNSIGIKLALIPDGDGLIGSPPTEAGRRDDEARRTVKIRKPFCMGVYEVTQGEYEKVMGKPPSHFSARGKGKARVAGTPMDRFPVETVSFDEAKAFCDKLTGLPGEKEKGRVYRLPTEAEWEYACRAGTKTATHYGDALSSKQANFNGDDPYGKADDGPYLGRPCPVGGYAPNAWGLHDMHGNVAEWTSSKDAKGISSRVTRGGSWDQSGKDLRSARRDPLNETPGDNQTGFRVVCEVPSP